jgi:uncharacterized ion transporter superfamily protein YfcC
MTFTRMPHPFALLVGCVFLAAALSYVVPAGEYERHEDAATKRQTVVPGSYHRVPANPVTPFRSLIAIPRGMADAASVIFLVFLVGGAITVVEKTGAFKTGVLWLVHRFRGRPHWIVPVCCVAFATGGVVEGMWEEVVALVPVLLLLARMAGFDALTAVAMSIGAAGIGGAFSPLNPFNVGIAQKIAELPLLSGLGFRLAILIPAVTIWTWGTMRHAARHRRVHVDEIAADPAINPRHALILVLLLATFAGYVVGVLRYDWGFDELGAIFFAMGILAGALGGLGISGISDAFIEGFRSMAYAATLIGVARAIFVVLGDGKIVDTMIQAMVSPLQQLPRTVFVLGMAVVQTVISIPVPSSSGRAVLTLPILVPASDLLGVSRQVTVLAYQYGAGVLGQMLPTDGALMAVLALAGVRFDRWVRFCLPLCAILFALGLAAIVTAMAIGLQ